jgi:hypothetical protein
VVVKWPNKYRFSRLQLVSIEQLSKFLVSEISQFLHDQRILVNAHQQYRIGRERHDLVDIYQIAGGEMLGFAQGPSGVFDHDILLALPAGFVGNGFAPHRICAASQARERLPPVRLCL